MHERGSESVVGHLGDRPGAGTPPSPDDPARLCAWQLVAQARACQVMGSPLYALLLTTVAQDVLAEGPAAQLLVPHVRPGRGDAAGLRLMAAVHRRVLERRAPRLALHYPTVGGTPDPGTVGGELLGVLADGLTDGLADEIARPCQTNEVGRAAGLLVGLLDVTSRHPVLPLDLREVGAAAGLNLRLDRWRYELPDGVVRGDPDGEVVLRDRWTAPVPHVDAPLEVASRRGVDLRPLDVDVAEHRTALSSSVWADQTARFARLGAAIRTAQRVPATVDAGSAAAWAADHVTPTPGRLTVLYQSIVDEYLPDAERDALRATVEAAGARATADAPVAWVRMEPSSVLRHHAVSVQLWPNAPQERLVARTHAHGDEVTPLDVAG